MMLGVSKKTFPGSASFLQAEVSTSQLRVPALSDPLSIKKKDTHKYM